MLQEDGEWIDMDGRLFLSKNCILLAFGGVELVSEIPRQPVWPDFGGAWIGS
jgi:hypothetical protein